MLARGKLVLMLRGARKTGAGAGSNAAL
ncbi:hypothetical protein BASA61_003960, partial [Batrachochytrium salamandrivorans]